MRMSDVAGAVAGHQTNSPAALCHGKLAANHFRLSADDVTFAVWKSNGSSTIAGYLKMPVKSQHLLKDQPLATVSFVTDTS